MPASSKYKELFRNATIKDKLSLLQTLVDGREDLSPDLALALMKIIHGDLSIPQTRDRSPYKRYAELVEALRFHTPGLLKQVVENWKAQQNPTPAEWFSEHKKLW
ncbi:MAG: hypothetical protein K8S20_03045 [Chloroflexi bacterium]|nr:hypothetical protein [Chloroflexota bacterium]